MLRTLTRNNPLRSTGSHVAILGHITQRELRKNLTEERLGAGIGNRFMFVLVTRSKALPHGGKPRPMLPKVMAELREAIRFGQGADEIHLGFEEDQYYGHSARELWEDVYEGLMEEEDGLVGSITSRGPTHVRKLASIYAVLDKSPIINVDHLYAGLACWQYAEDSARYIFGDLRGDPLADDIKAILELNDAGMTRWELVNYFGRNIPAKKLNAAIENLLEAGLIREDTDPHEGPGRPARRYRVA